MFQWDLCIVNIIFLFQIKSRSLETGRQQLENAVFGLWKEGQKAMIAILCVGGKVSEYSTIKINILYHFNSTDNHIHVQILCRAQ